MAIRKQPNPQNKTDKLEEDLDKYIAKTPDTAPDYYVPRLSKPKRHVGRNVLLTVLLLVTVGTAAGGGYWFATQRTPEKTSTPTVITKQTTPKSTSSTSNGTARYVAAGKELNLSFDYPSNWSVSPASNTKSDKPITVTSPTTSITAADGTSATGKVTVTIRPGSATVTELDSNNPTIPQNSYQVAYTAPSATQNQYPYLTFIHYDNASKTEGAFEQVIVTGIRPFNKGEVINSTALVGLDPITSATFTKCATQACSASSATRLGINDATWQSAPIFKQTLKIFESLKIN